MQQQEVGSLGRAVQIGLKAARANILPGLVIWAIAGSVIAAYYGSDWARVQLESLAAFKNQWNWWFAACSTVIAGAVIPGLVRAAVGQPRVWKQMPWLMLFWATKGIEVNAFYLMQTHLFGADTEILTLLKKTCLDQLVYIPLWGVPSMAFAYTWIELGTKKAFEDLRGSWFRDQLLPVMLANWGVWLPTVILIYMLPTALQLPLQNLVLCFWGLLMAFLAQDQDADGVLSPQDEIARSSDQEDT